MVNPTKRKRGRPPKRKPATVTEETVHSRLVRGRPQRKRPRPTTPVATRNLVPPPRPDTILHHAVPISILKPSVPETTTWNSTGASSCIPNSWQYVPNLGLHTLIACLSLRNDGAYLAVADGVGCITVFSTTPLLRPVGQVSTGLGMKNVKWAIQYMAWNQHCLMVANPQCLQCLDFQKTDDPILWTKPILTDTTLQGMEVHKQTVLVWTTDLNLYQTEIRETTEWTSVDSNCCAAKSFQSRLLLVTTDATGLLLHYQHEPHNEARIPMKRIVTQATLQVHNHSTVVLACAKGIRLYNPQLELLQIVGETVSLHGKTVCWQDALIWQAPQDNTVVVGIPSGTKEPKELANVLHLFSKQQLQYWTGPKPANTGIRQVALLQNRQLIVLSQSGHLQFQNLKTPHSNWPGTMYAPGYRVINDNLEYLEQEDELDHPQDEPAGNHIQPENQEHATKSNNESERLDEAPPEEEEELQGLEQALTACDEDEPVVVVDEDASTQDDNDILPCRPLVHLQQQAVMDSSQDAAAQTTTTTTLHLSKVLQEMPNHSLRTQPKKSTVVKSDAPVRASGKRSRASNVEALLKASIDPVLQQFMLQRDRTWSNGRRSTHNPISLPTESSVDKSSNGDDDMQPPSTGNESSSKAAPEDTTEEAILNPATTDDATSTNESATEDSVQKTATNVQTSAVHKADALPKDISSPKPSPPPAAQEEQAVALQLLNLSPGRPTVELLPDVKPTMALAMPSDDGLALKTTEAVPLLSKRAVTENANETKQPESAAVLENNWTVKPTETTIPCHACRGRMVIHSCGKRAIPIDHEAVARAERERLQKEEDEKRRIRTEKRRLADAKRREARKRKQKEAEERLRKAEQERLQKERAQLEEARRLAAARSRDWPEVESWRRVIFPGETSGRLEEKHEHSEVGTDRDRSQGVSWPPPPQDPAPESDPWRRKDLLPESNPPWKTPPTQAIWPPHEEPSQSDDKPWGNGNQTSKMNEAQQRQGDSLRQPSDSYDQVVAQSRSPQAQTLSSEQSHSTNWQAQEPSFSSPGLDTQQQQVSMKSQPFLANGQWTSKPTTVNHLSRKDPPAAGEVPANRAQKDWSSSSQGAEAAFGHFQSRFRQNEERSCWLVASPIATKSTGTLRPASPTWPKESAPVSHTTAHKPTDEFGQSKRDETASGSRTELDSSATLDHATALAALAGLADMPVLQPKAPSEGNPVYASQWSASSNDAAEVPQWTYGASESGAVWLGSNVSESEPAGTTRHDWRVEPREAQVRESAHQTFITGYSEAASFVVTSPETWRNENHHPGDGTFVAQGTSSLNDTAFPPQEKS